MSKDPIIEFRDASIYQKDNLVLSKVNLQINEGEFVYLIGKTGSGKSSLLKTMYADLPLKEGELMVATQQIKNIKKKDIPKLRRKLGIVFQDFQLLSDRTVRANLEFVLYATGWKDKSLISKRIEEVMESVTLHGKGNKMPHELSGGEQQRVVIARALLNDPEVILADEPTGNLDPEISDHITNLLRTISQSGISVIIATHNYSLIDKFPGRVLICENGKVQDKQ